MSLEIAGYTIKKKLGAGGMSTVYLAIQESLGRPCAIKVLSSALSSDEKFTARFTLEAKTIAKLQRYNIVNIYDVDTTEDCCYIAMEYIPGGTLNDYLQRNRCLKEVLDVIKQVASALGFAHEHNIIHRDIKPANIMFRGDGTTVLTDFGIAKYLSEDAMALTGTGLLIGTPAYMSPEQIREGELTGRSDLYSLGVVFYKSLMGVQPYIASNPISVSFMHVNTPIPKLPASISFLQEFLDKLLAKDPADRFQTATDLIAGIEEIERRYDTEQIMLIRSKHGEPHEIAVKRSDHGSTLSRLADTALITFVRRNRHFPYLRSKWKWWLLSIPIVAIMFAGLSYKDYRAEQRQHSINVLLETAERQLKQGRFVAPEQDNLYITLQALDKLSEEDFRTIPATDQFIHEMMIKARRHQARDSFDKSLKLIEKGLTLSPAHTGLQDLHKQVVAQRNQHEKELQLQQQQQAINRLLSLADEQLEHDQLLAPDGYNAVNSLRQVLALAPKNEAAKSGIQAVASRFAQLAEQTLADGNKTLTQSFITQGLSISENHPGLLRLQDKLDQRERERQAEQEHQRQIPILLADAATQLEQGLLPTADAPNLLDTYQKILQLDADNVDAKAGIAAIVTALAKRAKLHLQQGEFDASLSDIDTALSIAADDNSLLELRKRVLGRQQEIRQQELAQQKKIELLLLQARRQIRDRQLSSPARDNAVVSYKQVLALEHDHQEALQGLQHVADLYEALAREQMEQGEGKRSEDLVAVGLGVIPEHNGLLSVQRELLERARERDLKKKTERAARERQINLLLATAEKQLAAQQLTEPDNDNAYASWRSVLALDANNQQAQQSIANLPSIILGLADSARDDGNLTQSLLIVKQGLQVWSKHNGLLKSEQLTLQRQAEEKRTQRIEQLLVQAEQQTLAGQLISPEGNNAVATLHQVLEIDNTNAAAKIALDRIVDGWLDDARRAIDEEQLEPAEVLLDQAGSLAPAHPQHKELQRALEEHRKIKSLIAQAEVLAGQHRFLLPEQANALASYRQVLKLDPAHTLAKGAIAELPQQILAAAQDAFNTQQWDQCSSLIKQGLTIAPGHEGLLALREEHQSEQQQFAEQREREELTQRVDQLLVVAGDQIARKRLTLPPGDSAATTLEQILVLSPGNPKAIKLQGAIANRYAELAAKSMRAGNNEKAMVFIARGLTLLPHHAKLIAQREEAVANLQKLQAEQTAGEQRRMEEAEATRRHAEAETKRQQAAASKEQQQTTRELNTLLEQAEQQRAAGRYILPAGDSALDTYRRILALNPQFSAALNGIDDVIGRYRIRVETLRKQGDIPGAGRELETILAEFPDNTELKALQTTLLRQTFRDALRDGGHGPALVYIPPGTFTMGDIPGKGFPNEKPTHPETVSRGFLMSINEVTFAEFDRFVQATGQSRPSDNGWGRDKQPVINVDWQMAHAYVAWLSEQTGQQYRLPSEMEWELAARAGTDTAYWWGPKMKPGHANCKGCGSLFGGKQASTVGLLIANPFGLFDTAGNVYEWVSSPYQGHYPKDGSSLAGPGKHAVVRGGSWFDDERFSRVSMRVIFKPGFKNFFVGFRVLRNLPAKAGS